MGFPILVRWHLYIESGPCLLATILLPLHSYYVLPESHIRTGFPGEVYWPFMGQMCTSYQHTTHSVYHEICMELCQYVKGKILLQAAFLSNSISCVDFYFPNMMWQLTDAQVLWNVFCCCCFFVVVKLYVCTASTCSTANMNGFMIPIYW